MKIAICYSGMFRSFLTSAKNHKKMIYGKYDCDIYASLWDVIGHGGVFKRYDFDQGDIVSKEDKEKLLSILNFKAIEFENFKDYQDSLPVYMNEMVYQPNPKNVLSMYYKIKKAGEMVKSSGIRYDLVIRMRTDILFGEPLEIEENIDCNTLYTPFNGSWGDSSVGDQFFYGVPEVMSKVYKLYDDLKELWKVGAGYPSPPECILHGHLYHNSIQIIRCMKPWIILDKGDRGGMSDMEFKHLTS